MKSFSKILTLIFLACSFITQAQEITQTIKGKITDTDSKTPLIGANVIVIGTDPVLGAGTDIDGNYKIENVPVGRVTLKITSLGYEEQTIPNILVGSGKEVVLNIPLAESVQKLEDVTVTAKGHKAEVINQMTTVSAVSFSVEETNRFSGSLNDPARMVSGFAGVVSDPEGNNDIVVRGNSPRGILWRLEGVEIPNPNHFANEGSTGGPVNSLNPSMLANSDFFSGAFAPEYGNASSGVFDIYFRTGNNEKREYSCSAGIIGLDFTAEGPFKQGYKGSYLVNYRYSSLDIMDKVGIINFGGVPKYQDASFKIDLPTKKAGKFSLFGLGGESHILQTYTDKEVDKKYADSDFRANIGVIGLNHSYIINEKTYIKSYISASTALNGFNQHDFVDSDNKMFVAQKGRSRDGNIRFSSTLNKKLNAKNKVQLGFILTSISYNKKDEEDFRHTGTLNTVINANGNSGMAQAFVSWKYRINENLTAISGVHFTQFLLNNNNSVEPRLGIKYQLNNNQALSLGYGIHSKLENLSTYLSGTSSSGEPGINKNLELTKAMHFVIGYNNQLSHNLNFKTEIYYQYLYDIPVENNVNSNFAISYYSQGYTDKELVNDGTGRNYGIELTLERFFDHNFYYLATASLYQSKYTAKDGVERDSRYNANYAGNVIIGKEFKVGDKSKNKTIGFNSRITLIGGNRYTPIDLEASKNEGYQVYDENRTFACKGDDVFFINIGFTYRRDRKKTTHELMFDVRNVTNNKATVMEYYNGWTGQIEKSTQLPMIPNISYSIKF